MYTAIFGPISGHIISYTGKPLYLELFLMFKFHFENLSFLHEKIHYFRVLFSVPFHLLTYGLK